MEDKATSVAVRVRRPGLRTIHPDAYLFRSVPAKRESLLRAAYLAPEMFDTGVMRAHLFPIRPTDARSWDALLAVSFPVPLAETRGKAADRDFGAVLRKGSDVLHRFSRRIRLQPDHAEVTSRPLVTFLEPVSLAPGDYTVTAVLADPATVDPHAAKVQIVVPEIPRKEIFLVGPILGRRAETDVVVRSGRSSPSAGRRQGEDTIGDPNSFQPFLVWHLDDPADVVALTEACVVGKKRGRQPVFLARSLETSKGVAVGAFEPAAVDVEGDADIRCQNFLDVLPARSVKREGVYVYRVSLDPPPADDPARAAVRFSVGMPERKPASQDRAEAPAPR